MNLKVELKTLKVDDTFKGKVWGKNRQGCIQIKDELTLKQLEEEATRHLQ